MDWIRANWDTLAAWGALIAFLLAWNAVCGMPRAGPDACGGSAYTRHEC